MSNWKDWGNGILIEKAEGSSGQVQSSIESTHPIEEVEGKTIASWSGPPAW